MSDAELARLALLWAADNMAVWVPAVCMALLAYVLGVLHLVAWAVGLE